MLPFHRTGRCLDFDPTGTRCPLPPQVPQPHPRGGEVTVPTIRLLLHNVLTHELAAGSCLIPRTRLPLGP